MMDFDTWKTEVDREVTRLIGLSADDLPDIDYRGLFESGTSPKDAAVEALRNALPFPDELFD